MNEKKKYGYARVSMLNQDLALQLDALKNADISENNIFVEKISGKLSKSDRPQLKACLRALRAGDSLSVWKLDRMGRSLKDLMNIIQELEERKIMFRSLTETIDTSSPTGRLLFHIMGAFGEFERNLIRERSMAGQEAARRRGAIIGRKNKLSQEQQKRLIGEYLTGTPLRVLTARFDISKTSLYEYLRAHNTVLRNN
jgi:DNA invertase Pin-like site-specific DNA recombinase